MSAIAAPARSSCARPVARPRRRAPRAGWRPPPAPWRPLRRSFPTTRLRIPLRDDLVSGARQVRSAANALATAASRRQKARYAAARERLNDADRDLRGDVSAFAELRIAS